MNYDEMIAWLSERAADCLMRAGIFAREGMVHTERGLREEAATLITAENMLRWHARWGRD